MKFKISYTPEETKEALEALELLRKLHPSAKVRRSDAHPPFKQIYLVTPKPEENACNSSGVMV